MAIKPGTAPLPDLAPLRRALLSVYDKSGLVDLAKALAGRGVELISTGGTRAALTAAGIASRDVSQVTGFPEIMGGRVKTLHPKNHGYVAVVVDPADYGEVTAALSQHDGATPLALRRRLAAKAFARTAAYD